MQNEEGRSRSISLREVALVLFALGAIAVFAGPALAVESEQERVHGWALSEAGKRRFPQNFLCVRVGATDAQDIFVIKPRPTYPLKAALATLSKGGLLGAVEYRLKFQYTADVEGLARAVYREEPAKFRGVAHVDEQFSWTPGGGCPSVGINIPPPEDTAATAWARQTAAKYGTDRVTVEHAIIVQPEVGVHEHVR